MRGHVRPHGRGWAVVIDLGRAPLQRCGACQRRYWVEGRPLDACPRCGGPLEAGEARRQRWQGGLPTRADAERVRADLLSSGRRPVASGRGTLSELIAAWLPAKRATIKASSWAVYERNLSAYVARGPLGATPLQEIDGPRLTVFYAHLLERGRATDGGPLSPTTVAHLHALLHKVFADAVRWGLLARNPAEAAEPPRRATPELNVWTASQLSAFLESVRRHRAFAAFLLLATTGMRRGEVLGLRWRDIDFERSTLSIGQTLVLVGDAAHFATPKTRSGARTIALDPATLEALAAHHRRQRGRARASDHVVFARLDGSPIHPKLMSAWFRKAARGSGLPPIRLHDVRHSYATAMIRAGVPVKVVSQRIGHSNPIMTMTIYQHVLPGDDAHAALVGARAILGG